MFCNYKKYFLSRGQRLGFAPEMPLEARKRAGVCLSTFFAFFLFQDAPKAQKGLLRHSSWGWGRKPHESFSARCLLPRGVSRNLAAPSRPAGACLGPRQGALPLEKFSIFLSFLNSFFLFKRLKIVGIWENSLSKWDKMTVLMGQNDRQNGVLMGQNDRFLLGQILTYCPKNGKNLKKTAAKNLAQFLAA